MSLFAFTRVFLCCRSGVFNIFQSKDPHPDGEMEEGLPTKKKKKVSFFFFFLTGPSVIFKHNL